VRSNVAVALIVLGTLASASGLSAETLLFVSVPEPITEATQRALRDWGVEIVASDEPSLGAKVPEVYDRAKDVAGRHKASAVVWLADSHGRPALWIYDSEEGLLATRQLKDTENIDEATAAALALSIKTILRHSQIAPPDERLKALAEKPRPPSLILAAIFGTRLRSVSGTSADLRFGVDVQYARPSHPRLSGYMRVVTGPGLGVNEAELDGRLADTSLGFGVGVTAFRHPGLEAQVRLGADIHVTRLEGTLTGLGRSAEVRRLNPAASGSFQATIPLTYRFRVGGIAGTELMARRQDYRILGQTVLRSPRVEFFMGIFFALVAL